VTVTRLSGGLTPGVGGDPRTFPAIWNATADTIEAQGTAIADLEDLNPVQFGTAVPSDGQVLAFSTAVSAYVPEDIDAGGKVLQVVRATDSTTRTTTSSSMADAGISVSITPTSATSNVLLIWSTRLAGISIDADARSDLQITNSANTGISGALRRFGLLGIINQSNDSAVVIGFDSPATTSSVTYKGRFATVGPNCTTSLANATSVGQLFAIELGA
jgi:hypothetical protein